MNKATVFTDQIKYSHILHIHSDYKFAQPSSAYQDVNFLNDILFIGKIEDENHFRYVTKDNRQGLKSIIKYCNSYDLVVLYNLSLNKAYIANRIDRSIPIIWRFFGNELYGRMPDLIYSEATKEYLKKNRLVSSIRCFIKNLIFSFNKKYFCFSEKEYRKAIKRIDFFCGLFYEEYRFLSKKFSLPKFLQLPYIWNSNDIVINEKKGNRLLIGNSQNIDNNHLEIIEKLADNKSIEKFLFLNYKSRTQYREYLISRIIGLKGFYPITTFLSKKEYTSFYQKLDALALNSYRQMAVGNIFTAFQYGVKVYLNKKNLYYYFLLENGFLVFDIDDLKFDVDNKTLSLSKDQIIQNHKAIDDLREKYSVEKFVTSIIDITSVQRKTI